MNSEKIFYSFFCWKISNHTRKKFRNCSAQKKTKQNWWQISKWQCLTHPGMVVELSLPNFLEQEQLKTGFFFSIPLDFSDKGEFVTKGYLGLILKRLEWANLLNCANLSFPVQGGRGYAGKHFQFSKVSTLQYLHHNNIISLQPNVTFCPRFPTS